MTKPRLDEITRFVTHKELGGTKGVVSIWSACQLSDEMFIPQEEMQSYWDKTDVLRPATATEIAAWKVRYEERE